MIDWQGFSWEAFATLLTGALAVAAATAVAIKQVEITNRQVQLQELKLRHDMFERRVKVYNTIRNYIQKISLEMGPLPERAYDDFIDSVHLCQFLFGPEINEQVLEIQDDLVSFMLARSIADDGDHSEKTTGDIIELRGRLLDMNRKLPPLFQKEMNLAIR